MNLSEELDKTIELLEAQIPANPAAERNESLEKGLRRAMAKYFRDLGEAIDWDALGQIYYRNVKQE